MEFMLVYDTHSPKKNNFRQDEEGQKVMIQAHYTQTLNEFVKESRPQQPLNHTGDTGQHDSVLSRASSLLHALPTKRLQISQP